MFWEESNILEEHNGIGINSFVKIKHNQPMLSWKSQKENNLKHI